jgi:hypothetical protein
MGVPFFAPRRVYKRPPPLILKKRTAYFYQTESNNLASDGKEKRKKDFRGNQEGTGATPQKGVGASEKTTPESGGKVDNAIPIGSESQNSTGKPNR